MSNAKKHETVADIVADMRDEAFDRRGDLSCANERAMLDHYADRIEAAMKRNCEDCTWYHIYNDGLSELREERDRLRAALRPVLECKTVDFLRCLDAVREAQRIYTEGGANE